MIIAVCLILALACVALSAFYSGSETGLYCLNRLRLKVDADRQQFAAQRLSRLLENEQTALSTLLIGTNLANYLTTVIVAYMLAARGAMSEHASEIVTTAIVTPILFVFGEVVPKNLFQRRADPLMRTGSALFQLTYRLLRWPVTLLDWMSRPIIRAIGAPAPTGDDDPRRNIAILMREALDSQASPAGYTQFIDRVLDLKSVSLRQVMVPAPQVVAISAEATRTECHQLARKQPHSRFPVHAKDSRRMIGYVELHTLLADRNWIGPRGSLREIIRLKPDQSVGSALVALQSAHEPIGYVEDRTGRMLGIVTLKDLLEELTGELHAW